MPPQSSKRNELTVGEAVRTGYAALATGSQYSCCNTGCCGQLDPANLAKAIGCDATSLETVPNGANMGLSCGNPLAIAALQEGQTVLDLGNGGGLCCQSFHFYTKVGDS